MADLFGIKQGYGCLNIIRDKSQTLEVALLDATNGDLPKQAVTSRVNRPGAPFPRLLRPAPRRR